MAAFTGPDRLYEVDFHQRQDAAMKRGLLTSFRLTPPGPARHQIGNFVDATETILRHQERLAARSPRRRRTARESSPVAQQIC